jgi:hypothetical protein
MPVRVSAGRQLRQRIIRGGFSDGANRPTFERPEKSPRRYRLGLNPPMKEVEETIGSIG